MEQHTEEKKTRASVRGIIWEIVKFAILSAIIVVPIRTFIAQPFIVNGSSMSPTFITGEYLIVDELSYLFNPPKRGDIVILRYPKNPSKFFIKRIIGLPRETVEIREGVVIIRNAAHPEGQRIDEPYVQFPQEDNMTSVLGAEEYFVMGDNRMASSDSRAWGSVPEENVVGRAFLRLFPIASADVLPGSFSF